MFMCIEILTLYDEYGRVRYEKNNYHVCHDSMTVAIPSECPATTPEMLAQPAG